MNFSLATPTTSTVVATRTYPDLSYQELRDFYAEHYHPATLFS